MDCGGYLRTSAPRSLKPFGVVRGRSPKFAYVRQRPCPHRMTANDSQDVRPAGSPDLRSFDRTAFPARGSLNRGVPARLSRGHGCRRRMVRAWLAGQSFDSRGFRRRRSACHLSWLVSYLPLAPRRSVVHECCCAGVSRAMMSPISIQSGSRDSAYASASSREARVFDSTTPAEPTTSTSQPCRFATRTNRGTPRR